MSHGFVVGEILPASGSSGALKTPDIDYVQSAVLKDKAISSAATASTPSTGGIF